MILGMDRYRLELHWDKVEYKEGVAQMTGAYFTGPVLQISQRLNEKDKINIDMTNQYTVFIPNFYIAELEWNGIRYEHDRIYLDNVRITNKSINSTPKLKHSDYFVIDTSKHEEQTHPYYMNYDCYLVNENGVLYKF